MTFQEILWGPLGQRLAWTLLHFLWQGLVISAGVAALACLLSPAETRGRYALALVGLVLMACCPLVTFGILQVSPPNPVASAPVPELPMAELQSPVPVQVPIGDMTMPTPPPSVSAVDSEPSVGPVPEAKQIEIDWHTRLARLAAVIQPYAITAWLVGVVALSGRLLISVLGVRRLARGRLPVSAELATCATRLAERLGLSASPGVYLSKRIREAMLVGLWRPMVLLPAAWIAEMPPDVLEAVIAHELAHVRRLDLWANLLQRLVETLLFYHPAVWWLSRRASLLREMCADDLAVEATGERMTYASVLELLGRRRLKLPAPQLAAGIGGRKTALFDRVRNVLGVVPGDERLRWWPAGLLALLVPVGLWLVSVGMAQSPPQPAAEEKADSLGSPPALDAAKAKEQQQNRVSAQGVLIPPSDAQDPPGLVNACERAVAFLAKEQVNGKFSEYSGQDGGITALVTLALLNSGLKPDDPRVSKPLAFTRALYPKTTYVVSLQTLVLCAAEPQKDIKTIRRNVNWLQESQIDTKPRAGAWTYFGPEAKPVVTLSDNSNTQYAMLALHEADLAGVSADNATWRRALNYWLTTQNEDGSWGYRKPMFGTGSMTCAGIACVSAASKRVDDNKTLAGATTAIQHAENWLAKHFTLQGNPPFSTSSVRLWHFCYLYDLERAARLTGSVTFGDHDWRKEGIRWLLDSQDSVSGAWKGSGFAENNPVISTSLALLFLRPEAASSQLERTRRTVGQPEGSHSPAPPGEATGKPDATPAGKPKDTPSAAQSAAEWSETLNGLRVRLLAPKGTTYRQGAVLPLVAEVQNNSDKPIACSTLWHTVRMEANDADGKLIGGWMGPEMGDWVGQSADLAPGQTTQARLWLQSLRFLRPLKPGETIRLQAGAPTQKLRQNQFPLEVSSPALEIHLQNDAFATDVADRDFPAEWKMNLACELYMGFKSGIRYLQVDEHGAAKLLNAYQANGQRINNCLEVTLPPERLKELATALRQMQAWKLSRIPRSPPPTDAGSIRLSLVCASGASVVGQYPSHLESSQPVVADLRKLVEGLIGDIEKTAKQAAEDKARLGTAPNASNPSGKPSAAKRANGRSGHASIAKSASVDKLAIDVTVVGIDGKPAGQCQAITVWEKVKAASEIRSGDYTSTDPRDDSIWRYACGGHLGSESNHYFTGNTRPLPPGVYRVTAFVGARQEKLVGIAVSNPVQLDGSRGTTSVTVPVQDGPPVAFSIVDADTGEPVHYPSPGIRLTRPDGFDVQLDPLNPGLFPGNDGKYRIEHLAPGRYHVDVSARAYAYGYSDYQLGKPIAIDVQAGKPNDFLLKVAAKPVDDAEARKRWPWVVEGTVTDDAGRPLQGVEIRAATGIGTLGTTMPVISDAQGRYLLRFGPGMMMMNDKTGKYGAGVQAAIISARKAGYAEKDLARQGNLSMADNMPEEKLKWGRGVVLPGKPYRVDFVMVPAAVVQARLFDEKGDPLPNAGIYLTGDVLPPASSIWESVTADREGRFRFDAVPPGFAWWFQVGNGKDDLLRTQPVTLAQGQSYTVELRVVSQGDAGKMLRIASVKDSQGNELREKMVGDDPRGRPLVDAQTEAKAREILARVAEVNRYWLAAPAKDVTSFSYTFHLTGHDSREVTYQDYLNGTSWYPEWYGKGISYTGAARVLTSLREEAKFRELKIGDKEISIFFVLQGLPSTVAAGNGIVGTWHGFAQGRMQEGRIMLDAKRLTPISIECGRDKERYDDYVEVRPSAYVPLSVDIERGGIEFHWKFKVWKPGLWLFDKSQDRSADSREPVAWTTNVTVNGQPAVLAVTGTDTAKPPAAEPKPAAMKPSDPFGKPSAAKPTNEVSPSNSYNGGTRIVTGSVVGGGFAGTVTVGGPLLPEPMMSKSHPNDLDFPFYQPLLNDRMRTVLRLSGEQKQKLRELSRKYVAEFRPTERKLFQELDKATANSLPEEKNRKLDETWIKIRKMARPVRQQVEALLTPEQLAKLRKLALIDRRSAAILVYDSNDPKARARLTEEQKKEIEQLCLLEDQFTMKAYEKIVHADRENDEKAVAILTPPQREQIEREIREGEAGMPVIFGQQLSFQFTTPPDVGHVDYPPLGEFCKELGLSREQMRKLNAIAVDSRCSQELFQLYKQPPDIQPKAGNDLSLGKAAKNASKANSGGVAIASGTLIINGKTTDLPRLTPQLEQTMKQPEFRQKLEELKKQFLQQIEVTLTPQQLATLKKLVLQKAVARRARDPEIPADLHPTEQQKAEMYRLEAHADTMHRLFLEGREKFVDALSPEQRQKCFENMEREEWKCW